MRLGEIMGEDRTYELREPEGSYKGIFATENEGLRPENMYLIELQQLSLVQPGSPLTER